MALEAMEVEPEVPEEEEEEEEEDVSDLEQALEDAQETTNVSDRIPKLSAIIVNEKAGPKATQIKERAVYDLIRAYCETGNYDKIVSFLKDHQDTLLPTITKAKTAKLVRQMLDIVCNLTESVIKQEQVARSILEWTIEQKRSFLRQRVQAKLAGILYQQENYKESLEIIEELLHELKKLDDKQLLVESHLLESQIQFGLRNLPKAKAALTASRTAANAIYVSPIQQASMDRQSGILHTEEGDYTTAHSYFLEAFEQLDSLNDGGPDAVQALKYMMLCKILDSLRKTLAGNTETINLLPSNKHAIKYAGPHLEALQSIASATQHRNLKELQESLSKYADILNQDVLIQHHLGILEEQLLESNLLRILEPYSRVEISHIAQLMELDVEVTEKKLSQMILDGKLNGILDQGLGHLVLYESDNSNAKLLEQGLDIVANMENVVSSLFERSKALRTVMM